MRNLKFITSAALMSLFFAFLAGCQYDEVLPEIIDPGDTISFAGEIIPIFNQSCNSAGCHNTGGIKPDLTPGNSYQALSTGGYIDTVTPDNSLLYQWMLGNKGAPMPLSGPNPTYNAKVLLWIQQGAQNN